MRAGDAAGDREDRRATGVTGDECVRDMGGATAEPLDRERRWARGVY